MSVRLLLDQNLSPRLASALADVFPDTIHVQAVGLEQATDGAVLRFALDHGFVIATKDSDFVDMALARAEAPHIVWLRLRNCSTREIQDALTGSADAIGRLAEDTQTAVLVLERPHTRT